MRGLLSAIRILTIVPIPGRDAGFSAACLPWFPIVGAILGATSYAIASTLGPQWPAGAAFLAVAAAVVLTGGLHVDGLADAADGLGGGRDKDTALAIMKDSRTGAFGVIAIGLALIGRTLATSSLIASSSASWLVIAAATARFMQIDMMVRLPSARPNGTAAALVAGARGWHWALGFLTCAAIGFAIGGILGLTGLAGALCVNLGLGAWFKRRVGGVTGDLIGTASEISEVSILLFAAFMNARGAVLP